MSNSTNNRWLTIVTILLLTANVVTLALLWTNKKHERAGDRHPAAAAPAVEFITQELKLDSAQQLAFVKLREEHQANQRILNDSIKQSKDALFELLKQVSVADSLIKMAAEQAGRFEQERDLATFKHFQKLRALCNKEQQNKFDNVIQDILRRIGGPKAGPKGDRRGPPPEGPPPGMENKENRPPPPEH
jgi:hypothetical protein